MISWIRRCFSPRNPMDGRPSSKRSVVGSTPSRGTFLLSKSMEELWHFNCGACKKWWSIGDAPADKKEWWCPWCGQRNERGDGAVVYPLLVKEEQMSLRLHLRFKDGKIANVEYLKASARWGVVDKDGGRGCTVLCFIEEQDAICVHGDSDHELVWGEVNVGMRHEVEDTLVNGDNVFYRIHKTENSHTKGRAGNDSAGTFYVP